MQAEQKVPVLEIFFRGVRKGWNIAVNQILPALMFAFVLVQILQATGMVTLAEKAFTPLMAPFGLPGIASVVIITAFFSRGAGASVAANMFNQGLLTAAQATVLFPVVLMIGSLIGNYVRVLLVAGSNPRYTLTIWGACFAATICVLALMSLLVL